jgi:hypothetical protein
MRLISILFVLFTLSACSEIVEVPEDKFGILFRLGEIKTSVSGPATLEINRILNTVYLVNKEDKIVLGNGKFVIRYKIADPIKYYLNAGASKLILVELIEKKLANYALKGKPVNTKELLYKMIRNMGLPIILE